MPPRSERFPIQKRRDEFEDSGPSGKSGRINKEEARAAKMNGEIIAAVPVPEAREDFNFVAYFEFIKKAYIELGKKVKEMGIEPKDVPAWESADATLDKIKLLSEEYATEPVPAKKKKIARDMEILGASFLSREKMGSEIEDAAREIRNERRDREDQKKKKGSPKEEAFGDLVSDTLQNIPEALKQQQYTERLAELAQVYEDTVVPTEVTELYKKLEDPKNRAAYLEYIRKAREGAKQVQEEESAVAEKPLVQVETRTEALTVDSEGTSKEWRERLYGLIMEYEEADEAVEA